MGASQTKPFQKLGIQPIKNLQKEPECPHVGKYNFYLIRHGYSCANFRKPIIQQTAPRGQESLQRLQQVGLMPDPHLSNWGIGSCFFLKNDYLNLFNGKQIDNLFCTTLLRTWETAYLLFGSQNMKNFSIAPFIKENAIGQSNNPLIYANQKQRMDEFVNYISNISQLNQQFNYSLPRYGLKKTVQYPSIYNESSLEDFFNWYITNSSSLERSCVQDNEKNIIVVTHSHLIDDWIKTKTKNNLFDFYKNNGYCVKVSLDYSDSAKPGFLSNKTKYNNVSSIEIVCQGFPEPTSDQIKTIDLATSKLCKNPNNKSISNVDWQKSIEEELKILEMVNQSLPNRQQIIKIL